NQALLDNSSSFMNLAEKYFSTYVKAARKDFTVQGSQIAQSVTPVKQTLDRYEAHLGVMEKERENAYGAITAHLIEMGKTQKYLHQETGNLVKALRVPHVRGRWGEITLKRVAELAGMAQHCDFFEQEQAGSGKGAVRPDMVITLPRNRKIIVDSKVPLAAYLDALEATDEAQQKSFLEDHARQVLSHINNLSSKKYAQVFSPTPEFVILFIPGENYFSAALSFKPDLIEKGVEKGVILATPTTLIALLKSVAYSWKQKKSYENAEEIRKLGVELFRRLSNMTDNINRLGKDIEKCVTTYNRTVGAMESRVMVSARKLEALEITDHKLDELSKVDHENAVAKQFYTKDNDA
ncbi:MAG: DNA recombination protein RmuC, partial [Desulfobacteraceae bacterium]|nr:DNA recombination protein RmuC [Desulfobacteraceae bacterium]